MRYRTFYDLREQQNRVIAEAQELMPGVNQHVGLGVNALIAALHETETISDVESLVGKVQSFSWLWLYKAIYTFTASLTCAESGFYSESLALNRSLSETLIQVLYLATFPTDFDKLPSMGEGRKRKLTFSKMFEQIAPGCYQTSYNFSSEFAHPGLGGFAYKMDRDDKGKRGVDQGIIFKADPFSHCFNEISMLILGFLRCIPIVFPATKMREETIEVWSAAII